MKNVVMKIFMKFHDLPENLHGRHYRFFVFINYAFLFLGILHFLAIFGFAFYKANFLAVYNIFSCIIWGLCIFLNLRSLINISLFIANLEVVLHASLSIVRVGWESGFHYYILFAPLIVFLSPIKIHYKILTCIFNCSVYLLLYFYSTIFEPILIIPNAIVKLNNFINITNIFFGISFLAYYYKRIVLSVEQNLEIAHKTTQNALSRLNEDLSDAANYIKTILPQPIKEGAVVSDYVFMPSKSLGGDAFGYNWIDKNYFSIFLLDVSGHGVSAALLSATIMNVLRSNSLPEVDFREPKNVLYALNRSFPSEENNDMFFTIWYGVYNKKSRRLTFASGGHPPALLWNKSKGNNRLIELGTKNYVVGGFEDATFRQDVYLLSDSSSIYVFSDGVYEFMQSNGIRWKYNDFEKYLSVTHFQNGDDLQNIVNPIIKLNNSDVFEDDFTILKVSFN